MNTIINYLLSVDDVADVAFDAQIGGTAFYIWERRGKIRISSGPKGEAGHIRSFTDPMDALAYVHGIVKEITNEEK